jgi:4-hydroxybenzoate polyprenyltransferase
LRFILLNSAATLSDVLEGHEELSEGGKTMHFAMQARGGSAALGREAVEVPLVFDLDGTILRTDSLLESLLQLVKSNIVKLVCLLPALFSGRALFKRRLALLVDIDPRHLTYNPEVLRYATEARALGRSVYLATAADGEIARKVADYLQLFDGVFASDGAVNLKGDTKAQFLVRKFGQAGFDYVGNAEADRHICRKARRAVMVLPSARTLRHVQADCPDVDIIGHRSGIWPRLRLIAKAIRLHQWAKNVLVYAPVLASHHIEAGTLGRATIAFLAFCMCASGAYVINDLLDLPHDRSHATKRHRPFASGSLSLAAGPFLIALAFGGAIALASFLSLKFAVVLLTYFVATVLYSFLVKNYVVADVIFLAGLYSIRVFAGGAATGIPISPWLLAFSTFLFLSLAMVKRLSELILLVRLERREVAGRGYLADDLPMLQSMAAASGYISVLVLALYVNSSDVRVLYHSPQVLWLLCPVLLFWISRILVLSQRGLMNDDPVVFALTDRVSQLTGLVGCSTILAAAWNSPIVL